MSILENGFEITRLIRQKDDFRDQKVLKVSRNPQAQADSTDLVLKYQKHLVLRMSGVDKIFVPLARSNVEKPLEEFEPSSLLEIQIVPSKIAALE